MGIDGATLVAKKQKVESRLQPCPVCKKEISKTAPACPYCGERFISASISADGTYSKQAIIGLVGTALLFFGVFCPIITLPIVGDVNYFHNGKGDGVALIVFSLLSFLSIMFKQERIPFYVGIGSLVFLSYNIYYITKNINETMEMTSQKLAGNPFQDVINAAFNTAQLQWGWAVLFFGALLLVLTPIFRQK